jgi:flagellum-specific peptidoglycan hydrolase FlgJ
MKYIITALLFVLSLCINAQSYTASYIESIKDIAIESTRGTNIPVSIKIAQSILETGWGRSKLCARHNNYFGVTGRGVGRKYRMYASKE